MGEISLHAFVNVKPVGLPILRATSLFSIDDGGGFVRANIDGGRITVDYDRSR